MREDIITRNTIITSIALFIFFFFSIFINSSAIMNNTKANVIASSNNIIKQMNALETDDIDEYVKIANTYSDSEWLSIIIASSDGKYLYNSESDIDYEFYSEKLSSSDILLATSEKSDKKRAYSLDKQMHYLTQLNNKMIVKTTIKFDNDFSYVLYNAFYLLILISLTLVIEIVASRGITAIFTNSIESITSNLNQITKGNYEQIPVNSKYKEVRDALKEINQINRDIYQYIQDVKIESDKISFIVNNMHQGIIITDLHKKILLINDYALSRLNITNKEDLYFDEIIDSDVIKDYLDDIIEDNTLDLQYDLQADYHVLNTDKIYNFRMSYIDGKWTDDSENGLIFISVINVTNQRKEEGTKTEFIANASHELKTPITSISGFSELLLSGLGETDETAKSYIQKIYDEADYMKKTIEELLYISNLEYNVDDISLEEIVDLDILIKQSVNYYQEKKNSNNITVESYTFPFSINGSSSLLTHLVNNLIENAIKYNKPNGKVSVNMEKTDDPNYVYLKVIDTGIGIDKKNLDTIFDRFYRIDKSRSRKTGGVGLGLSICKKICKYHHTNIEVESKVGVGSTFKVKFKKA